MIGSIRSRLLITLLTLVTCASLIAGWFAYRQAVQESATLFDYQLRQMALSLRNQVSLAQQIEVPRRWLVVEPRNSRDQRREHRPGHVGPEEDADRDEDDRQIRP